MSETATSPVVERVREEFEKGTDVARAELERNAEEYRRELDRRADGARTELGTRIVDLTEEYFPEEVAQRRRRKVAAAFAAGVGAGAVTRHFLGR